MLASALRTVVIPRPERVLVNRLVFGVARRAAHGVAGRLAGESRERVLGSFAPSALVVLPAVWSVGLVAGFALVFSSRGVHPWDEALATSGSSLTTLGFVASDRLEIRMIAVAEALIGLAIVGLMISFLPTIYGTFSRREVAIGRLAVRAGEPPDPVQFIVRAHHIGELDRLQDRWTAWEEWFVELGETHTSFPALVFFRSARPGRSWLRACEAALDTAAILLSVGVDSRGGGQATMIRSGFLSLRGIADFHRIEHPDDPAPTDPISVTRDDFDEVVDRIVAAGVSTSRDREAAWVAFAGWRVNYDRVVVELGDLVAAPPSHWERRGAGQTRVAGVSDR